MYLSDNDIIFVTSMSLILLTGLFLNALLLYLIIYKSPKNLTPYRIFLANTTITQIAFCALFFVTQPRILNRDTTSIIINLGLIQYSSEFVAVVAYFGSVHLAWNSFISLMLSMIYRYLSIQAKHFSSRFSISVCLTACIIPLLNFLASIQITTSRDIKTQEMLVGSMVPNLSKYKLVVSTNLSIQPQMIPFMVMITVSYLPIYIVLFWCRYKIHKKLLETSASQSSNTKENVKRLVNALTIQALCPLVSFFPAAISNALIQLGFVQSSMISYFIAPSLSLSCFADPIVSIIYITPYRRFVFRKVFAKNAAEVTQIKSIPTNY